MVGSALSWFGFSSPLSPCQGRFLSSLPRRLFLVFPVQFREEVPFPTSSHLCSIEGGLTIVQLDSEWDPLSPLPLHFLFSKMPFSGCSPRTVDAFAPLDTAKWIFAEDLFSRFRPFISCDAFFLTCGRFPLKSLSDSGHVTCPPLFVEWARYRCWQCFRVFSVPLGSMRIRCRGYSTGQSR